MNKKVSEGSILGVVFYIFAVVLLAVACFQLYQAHEYIAYIQANGNKAVAIMDAIGVYIQYCVPYFTYAFTVYGIGYLINRNAVLHNTLSNLMVEAIDEA